MKVSVFGAGYVGLVQAAVLAEVGFNTVCMDIDAKRVGRLKVSDISIFEPGLETLVRENQAAQGLHFTADTQKAVEHGDVLFIAVGTPQDEDGSADVRYVLAVAQGIGRFMNANKTVVVKSTVPVGTNDLVRAAIAKELAARGREELSFDVASNPEFLKEGAAVSDCMRPDRIVIGTDNEGTEQILRELYAPFNRNHEKIIVMSIRSAELTKYAANCMLATKISFMNEMARMADLMGADIEQIRKGIGSDPRIGYHFIYPGIGYGGSCFPKDLKAMIHMAEGFDFDPCVLNAVDERNTSQKRVLVDKILKRFGGDIAGRTFALWGLAFKPNTNDLREAPARVTMEALWEAGAKVQAFDPVAMNECRRIYGDHPKLTLADSKESALKGADGLVICTEWRNFVVPDFALVRRELKHPVIFDGRNLYDPATVARHGLEYFAVGRRN